MSDQESVIFSLVENDRLDMEAISRLSIYRCMAAGIISENDGSIMLTAIQNFDRD